MSGTLDSLVLRACVARVEILRRHCSVQYYARIRLKMERENVDTELLIAEIEKRVAIWDMESSDYSNRTIKRRNWEEIVDFFSVQ